MQSRGGNPFELAENWIPCSVTSLLMTPSRVKGCRSTQQTNGRMRLTTELANDAVNSLKYSSRTQRMHVESMDKKHFVLWRLLCGEALRRQSTAPSERQMRRDSEEIEVAALQCCQLLKGMTDCSVSSCGSPLEHVGLFLCTNPTEDARRSNAHFGCGI